MFIMCDIYYILHYILYFSLIVPRDFPYEEDSRPRSQSSKAAIPPPVYEEQDRPRSPTGPSNSFLANMG